MTGKRYGDPTYKYGDSSSSGTYTWTDDFSAASFSEGWIAGATWSLSGGRAINTPNLGVEKLTDGGMENWASATNLTSWTETKAGTSTINQETSVVYAGSNACRLDIDASNSNAYISQQVTMAVGTWAYCEAYTRKSAAGAASMRHVYSLTDGIALTLTTSYAAVRGVFRTTVANPYYDLRRQNAASNSVYFDGASVKALTLTELLAVRHTSSANINISAGVTVATGTLAGVVTNLDSTTAPANFLVAYHDGVNAKLDKCVGGTYTNLISAVKSYVADAQVNLVVVKSGSDLLVSLYYNSSQAGTQQTVSDAGIVSGVTHGLFSTYSGNSFSDVSFTVPGWTRAYGADQADRRLSWGLEVDWDNDGAYNGYNEALGRLFDIQVRRGRQFFLQLSGDGINKFAIGFQPLDYGTMTVRLRNEDGRLDPYNSSGALYNNLLPGRKFRLRVKDEDTGTIYNVMRGRIEEIVPDTSNGAETVMLTGVCGLKSLQQQAVNSSIQTSYGVDEAISLCLTQAGWADGSSIDSISDTMTYFWLSGRSAHTEINDLTNASLGNFFIANDGTAKYYSRNNLRATVATIEEGDIQYAYGVKLPAPWEVVANSVRVYARPRIAQAQTTLWQMAETPVIPAGESRTFWTPFTYNNETVPAENVATPTANNEYTMNTQSDGGGVDLTASFTVTMTAFSDTSKLVVTNGSASEGYITLLKVLGEPVTTTENIIEKENTASQAIYGVRRLTIDCNWLQDSNFAISMADYLASLLGAAREFPRVAIRNQPALQFGLDLFDRVLLSLASRSISSTVSVGYIEHRSLLDTCDVMETVYHFEPGTAPSGDYWVFPTEIGVSSIFGL